MKDYHVNIFYSEEDGGYIADIPDLPGCSAPRTAVSARDLPARRLKCGPAGFSGLSARTGRNLVGLGMKGTL